MNDDTDLQARIAQQTSRSIEAMERAISAVDLVRRRAAFGQTILPARGSVLASPVFADWNPAPDYFFHWLRDAAVVMQALVDLMQSALPAADRRRFDQHFRDIVRFSLSLTERDGAVMLRQSNYWGATQPEAREFLRAVEEVSALRGERLLGEPRFNPDGSIDIFRWSRPQYDGPALRALACLRYLAAGGEQSEALGHLLRKDLDFTLRHAGEPCVGPWEEQSAHHYSVALVQLGALVRGAAFIGDIAARQAAEDGLHAQLDGHWSEQYQVYTATFPAPGQTADDVVDSAQIIAVLDAGLPDGPHSIADPRVRKTQAAIESLFAREFPINAGRAAPALGRYRGDHYFGGGAWYPTTLAAASLYYRLARRDRAERQALCERGDAVMATVRALTPADGSLSEQVDRTTGKQTSAQHLTWSYAAFIIAASARERCSSG